MRYIYRPYQERIEARRRAAIDILFAIFLGLAGAIFLGYFL